LTEVLFTPWRLAYLSGSATPPAGCLFCGLPSLQDQDALVVLRGRTVYAVLNRFPYCNGHVMVIPFQHRPTLSAMSPEERAEILEVAARLEAALTAEYSPHGFNAGINIGRSAGAGVPDHAHLHLVPRWDGDTSFLTVVAGTRTVPEDLGVTWSRLRSRLAGPGGAA
jgi:ATP adenylyltransferase